ncbi:Response regulator [Sphingomonas antarctica]|uniref:response regulator n=1 Tax=Sphingomonas antarctica TaxID=2040274 RepID=UPI0039ECF2FC
MAEIKGLRVLVVEDEAMIAMLAEDMLDMAGCTLAGIASTLAEGLAAAQSDDFDVAMLDVNLDGENSGPIADLLSERGKPFIFTTGYGSDGVPDRHDIRPVCAKPYLLADLHAALVHAAGSNSSTSTTDS